MARIPRNFNRYSTCISFAINSLKLLFIKLLCIGFPFTMSANTNTFLMDTCQDHEKPIVSINIGNCTPAKFNTVQNYCMGYISLSANATDNQTPDEFISFEYKVDLYNDGKGSFNGFDVRVGPLTPKEFNSGHKPIFHTNPFAVDSNDIIDASGIYPLGTHKICWYATDSCGNMGALCRLFEVKDCEAPVLNCVSGVQVYSLPNQACITFIAKNFNTGSYDNCSASDKLIFYFNGDPQETSYTVCCDDFVAAGVCYALNLELQLWVEDEEGNNNFCKILILIQDDNYVCPNTVDGPSLQGFVESIYQAKKVDLTTHMIVNLYQQSKLMRTSQNNPFLFRCLAKNKYNIEATKTDDSLNAVNTFDLYLIQKQIELIDTFTDNYQFFTADVNQNGIIEADDYYEIKNLILGNEIRFKKCRPWQILPIRFDTAMIFSKSEKYDFEATSYWHSIAFRCFKMGDVNDFITPLNDAPLRSSTQDSLIFKYKNKSVFQGETITIDLYADLFDSIVGFQGTLQFDHQLLSYRNIRSNALTIDSNSIGKNYMQHGQLTLSWNEIYPRSIASNTILFSLEFVVLHDGDLCDALSFTSDLTPAEAYTESVLIKNIKLESCDVILINNESIKEQIRMFPNPVRELLYFDFPKETSFPLQLDIFTNDGKAIRHIEIPAYSKEFSCSMNSYYSGIYFIKCSEKNKVSYLRFIKV